ncbi:hypothetical protein Micbo1qcDRAFT_179875 [Microdochium bolleyi]|uniref:Uncharacterized protein n=1 Tax=Microdochium bolleyi TaxID=196109 RepID=A0A136INY6_9PEZI|nr:hypothetical protein Micbo1qcDRAFT_179875 [Microdochium bolleyi]
MSSFILLFTSTLLLCIAVCYCGVPTWMSDLGQVSSSTPLSHAMGSFLENGGNIDDRMRIDIVIHVLPLEHPATAVLHHAARQYKNLVTLWTSGGCFFPAQPGGLCIGVNLEIFQFFAVKGGPVHWIPSNRDCGLRPLDPSSAAKEQYRSNYSIQKLRRMLMTRTCMAALQHTELFLDRNDNREILMWSG